MWLHCHCVSALWSVSWGSVHVYSAFTHHLLNYANHIFGIINIVAFVVT